MGHVSKDGEDKDSGNQASEGVHDAGDDGISKNKTMSRFHCMLFMFQVSLMSFNYITLALETCTYNFYC